jgi:hypothetical protein
VTNEATSSARHPCRHATRHLFYALQTIVQTEKVTERACQRSCVTQKELGSRSELGTPYRRSNGRKAHSSNKKLRPEIWAGR